jgi:hypothetical protein
MDKISGFSVSTDLTDLSTDHRPNPTGQEDFFQDSERETLNLSESKIIFSCPAGRGSGESS